MSRQFLLFLLIGLAGNCGAALAGDTKAGSGTLYGKPWNAGGAMAYLDEGYTMVVLSDKPLDAKALLRDGSVDPLAIIDYSIGAKATVVKLMIDAKGSMTCFNVLADPDSANRCGNFSDSLKLTRRDKERVSGTLDWRDEGESLKLSFDLPIAGSARH